MPFLWGNRYVHRDVPQAPATRRLDRLALITFATSVAACGNGAPAPSAPLPAPVTSKSAEPVASVEPAAPEPAPAPSVSTAPSVVASAAPSTSVVAVKPAQPGAPGIGAYGAPSGPGIGTPTLNPGLLTSSAYGAPSTPTGPKGKIAFGSASGAEEDVRTLRTRASAFRQCFETVLKSDPTAEGKCKIDASIETSGAVTSASAKCTGTSMVSVQPCLKARVTQIKFKEGDKRSVSADLSFTRENPK